MKHISQLLAVQCVVCTFKLKNKTAMVCIIDESHGEPRLCEKHSAMREKQGTLKFAPNYLPVNRWAQGLKKGLYFYKVVEHL